MDTDVPAFVVGACGHGLAVTRALSRAGVEVHVLESNQSLPGMRSRFGHKHVVADINGPPLVDALLDLRGRFAPGKRPVLFLMNDRMVRAIAAEVERIAPAFRLSWATRARDISLLTDKSSLAQRCRQAGLNYPDSVVMGSIDELAACGDHIGWPRILKPTRPLSGFKVHVAHSPADALTFLKNHPGDFPILVQQWIEGDTSAIYFTALYFENGIPLVRFDGHKLRAEPMGNTTVAEPSRNDVVFDCARRFFAGSGISGPASIEIKFDPAGRPWVIEPTVGRTDFWVDLSIANGVNLPVIEFCRQIGRPHPPTRQTRRTIWIHAGTDSAALPWLMLNYRRVTRELTRGFFTLRFACLDWADTMPFLYSLKAFSSKVLHYLSS